MTCFLETYLEDYLDDKFRTKGLKPVQ